MYRALTAGSSAYDGLFAVDVRSTGMFCRPMEPSGAVPP
jgi:methylphosphotriester-DNA--protein-cysteine methyltransferase